MNDLTLLTDLKQQLMAKALYVATCESCTGGMIAAALTDISGSSAFFDRSFVTYSNNAKIDMVGLNEDIINKHGAVSLESAEAMAKGALMNSIADIAIAVTGIAGPSGGTPQKPVGLVCFGIATKNNSSAFIKHFDGDRANVRSQTVTESLKILLKEAKQFNAA